MKYEITVPASNNLGFRTLKLTNEYSPTIHEGRLIFHEDGRIVAAFNNWLIVQELI